MVRCEWARESELMRKYHDEVWGVPVHNDRDLFQFLLLEFAQAGLSWSTVLTKWDGYRKAFDNFDPKKVARYGPEKTEALLHDEAIIRNRLKVNAAVVNARKFLEVQEGFGSFSEYLWRFVDGRPIQNNWHSLNEIPTSTKESDALSADLKNRGFKFVGTTICYAFMQAVGMVNDHQVDCFRYSDIQAKGQERTFSPSY